MARTPTTPATGREHPDTGQDTDQPDSLETRILDAALARFEEVGIKKTTIEDIARQAGVDRVTVYRRIGSRDDVVQAVANREVATVFTEVAAIAAQHDDIERLVTDLFVTLVTRWRTHPVVSRMLTLEPDRLIAKMTHEGDTMALTAISAMSAILEDAVQRDLLPALPDLIVRAELMCRMIHSFFVAPHGVVSLDTDEQLAGFARTYLVPLVAG